MLTDFEALNRRGVYRLHQLVIELMPGVMVYDANGKALADASARDLGTLVHEYVHFLHNYGTLSGLTLVVLQHKLARHFSMTEAGLPYFASSGLQADSADDEEAGFATTLHRVGVFNGDFHLPTRGADRYRLLQEAEPVFLESGNVAELPVKAWRTLDGYSESSAVRIGFRVIEEAIAFELQRIITLEMGGDEPSPPHYPYLMLRKLRDRFCRGAPMAAVLRVAVLSLCVPHSMEYLLHQLRALDRVRLTGRRNRRKGRIRYAERLVSHWRSEFQEAPIHHLQQALREMYADRGSLEDATKYVVDVVGALRDERLTNPFFEIEAIEQGPQAVTKLLARMPPCEVLQHGETHSPVLVSFAPTNQEAAARRTLQSHLHFVNDHLRTSGFVATTALESDPPEVHEEARCPYFDFCNLPRRLEQEAACRCEPWKHARKDAKERCWFAEGVAGTFVRFKRGTIAPTP
ncbi:MAG: hypothetical protein H6716_20760 [Polyangiaceae bacterium]|nr:hypothetical protein [Polyangiaceae bacterium]